MIIVDIPSYYLAKWIFDGKQFPEPTEYASVYGEFLRDKAIRDILETDEWIDLDVNPE